MGKNLSRSMISKYGQNKSFFTQKESTTVPFKTASKRLIHKTVGPAINLVGNKIAEKSTKSAAKNIKDPRLSTTAQIPQPIGIPKEIYIPPEKQQHSIPQPQLLQL